MIRLKKRINRLVRGFLKTIATLIILLILTEGQVTLVESYLSEQTESVNRVESNEELEQDEMRVAELGVTVHDLLMVQSPNQFEQMPEEQVGDKTLSKEDIVLERGMSINQTTGVSKEEFREIIFNMEYDYTEFFKRNADLIYDTSQKYQINELFFCGIIALESGWGSSEKAIANNNYTSQMKQGKLIYFSSEAECIIATAESLRNNYLNEDGKYYNGTTINAVNERYCTPIVIVKEEKEVTLKYGWADRVYSCMERILFY